MVSSSEINRKLAYKREGKKEPEKRDFNKDVTPSTEDLKNKYRKRHQEKESHGYLVCENCRGFYELQENETLEDFSTCQCGGKLNYTEDLEVYYKKNSSNQR